MGSEPTAPVAAAEGVHTVGFVFSLGEAGERDLPRRSRPAAQSAAYYPPRSEQGMERPHGRATSLTYQPSRSSARLAVRLIPQIQG